MIRVGTVALIFFAFVLPAEILGALVDPSETFGVRAGPA